MFSIFWLFVVTGNWHFIHYVSNIYLNGTVSTTPSATNTEVLAKILLKIIELMSIFI